MGGGSNPFEQLQNNNNSENNNESNNTETTSALPNPWANNNSGNNNSGSAGARPQMTQGLQDAMMNAMMNNMPGMDQLPEQARTQMRNMFGNPEAMAAMQRPAVREAFQQIQQGVATINREAPALARAMGIPEAAGGFGGLGGGLGGASARPAAPAADTRPPEERFATQLQQLEQMGFTNKQNNIAALIATNGELNAAVD